MTMMAPAVDGTGGHGCYPATNTSPAPEHRAAAISPAGCAPTSPGQDQPLADLDAWADVDTGLQHVHVKGEDDPLRHLGERERVFSLECRASSVTVFTLCLIYHGA